MLIFCVQHDIIGFVTVCDIIECYEFGNSMFFLLKS